MANRRWFIVTFRLKQCWSMLLQLGYFSILHTRRQKSLPNQAIYVSNHASYLDIVFMYQVVRKPFIFMGKHTLLKWPLFGDFFRFMDIPVDRERPVSAARALVRSKQYLEEGWNLAIFPEGTIPASKPQMITFKDGAFKLAVETGTPLVPITFLNSWKLMSDPDDTFECAHPGIVRVIVHPPVWPGDYGSDFLSLSQKVKEVIEAPLQERYPKEYGDQR